MKITNILKAMDEFRPSAATELRLSFGCHTATSQHANIFDAWNEALRSVAEECQPRTSARVVLTDAGGTREGTLTPSKARRLLDATWGTRHVAMPDKIGG